MSLFAGALGASPPVSREELPTIAEAHAPGRVMVKLRAGAESELDALVKVLEGEVSTRFTLVPGLVSLRTGVSAEEALRRARSRPDLIEYAEPDYVWSVARVPNDTQWSQQWGMFNIGQVVNGRIGIPGADIDAPSAWDLRTGDASFRIAVIDSGINADHPDLAGNIFVNPGEIAGNGLDDDGNGLIDDVRGWDFLTNTNNTNADAFHGTHVAGILGAVGNNNRGIAGVMWSCKVLPLRFIGPTDGTTEGAIAALQYAVAMGAKVSNNSWGSPAFSQALRDAIAAAGQAGHLFVAASGNSGASEANYPARYNLDNIISVAATDSNDALATFSQYSPLNVDLAAPGVEVLSLNATTGYSFSSGTSMASPFVAGAAGLVWSYRPAWNYRQVRERILATARPVASLAGKVATGGALDLGRLMNEAYLPPVIAPVGTIPPSAEPGIPVTLTVSVDPREDLVLPGTVVANYRTDDGNWAQVPMNAIGNNQWTAVVRSRRCGDHPQLFVSLQAQRAGTLTYPAGGANAPMTFLAGKVVEVARFRFESPEGWSLADPADTATAGFWSLAKPEPTLAQAGGCPEGQSCASTDPRAGSSIGAFDVDGGRVTLTSPPVSLVARSGVKLSYWRWFSNNQGGAPNTDVFRVQLSPDNGATWTTLETVGPTGVEAGGGWYRVERSLDGVIPFTSNVRVRFVAEDAGEGSVVEAAVDDVTFTALECNEACPADFDGSGFVDSDDFALFVDSFARGCLGVGVPVPQCQASADLDSTGFIDSDDFVLFSEAFANGCP
ncbi:MAG: S8 family serine peptidase [Planctomycetota bacterium]|nr:S8 family serine peptidase [Planctomycetota bacterium]